MHRPSIAILGIPIQNLTLEEIIQEALTIIEESEKDRHSHHASPVNFHLFANAHHWNCLSVRHPELLKIARKANLSFSNSGAVRLLSYLLGSPLQETVRIKDLLIQLTQALGNKQKSIFLLGSTEKNAKAVAIRLHNLSPGIKVVGISTSNIFIDGEDLIYAPERMAVISEQINQTNPELLAINLGSPKQEIWYGRIKRYLRVPLILGVTSTLNELAENLSPYPRWAEQYHLQWLYRLFQNAKEIHWLQNLWAFFKGIYMSFPLVLYHNINRLSYNLFYSRQENSAIYKRNFLFLSPYRSLAVVSLPALIDKTNVTSLSHQIDESLMQDTLILDFRKVHHIQPEGFYWLIQTWQRMSREKKEIYGLGVNPDIKLLMQVHRVWDLFKEQICETPESLMARLAHKGIPAALYDSIHQKGNQVIVTLFGALDNNIDYESYLEKLTPIIAQKDCVLNLSFCTSIENMGFVFLLRLRKMLHQQGKQLQMCGLSSAVKKQFRLVKLSDQFNTYSSLDNIPTFCE